MPLIVTNYNLISPGPVERRLVVLPLPHGVHPSAVTQQRHGAVDGALLGRQVQRREAPGLPRVWIGPELQ